MAERSESITREDVIGIIGDAMRHQEVAVSQSKLVAEALAQPAPGVIIEAIAKISGEVQSIPKRGVNDFHHYSYATSGDILAELKDKMAEKGLVITQHPTNMFKDWGGNIAVGFMFRLSLGSDHWLYPGIWYGIGGDKTKSGLGDKYFNKALTAAEKYFLLKLFKIPTGDVEDADADAQEPEERPREQRREREPERDETAPPRRRGRQEEQAPPEMAEARELFRQISDGIEDARSIDELREVWRLRENDVIKVRAAAEAGFKMLSDRFNQKLAKLREIERRGGGPASEPLPETGNGRDDGEPPVEGLNAGSEPDDIARTIDTIETELRDATTPEQIGTIWARHNDALDAINDVAPKAYQVLSKFADDRMEALSTTPA